jgi:hypothetical protein
MIGIALNLWRPMREYAAVIYDWILGGGVWDDTGVWRDSAEWNDGE